MDNNSKFFQLGAHMPIFEDSLLNLSNSIIEAGGNTIQIFIDDKLLPQFPPFNKFKNKNNIMVYVHASYTINLARDWNSYSFMVRRFIDEIQLAAKIGAEGIVIHLGKSLEMDMGVATNNMYMSLIYILEKTKDSNIRILIETSSGQGSEMCTKIECLAKFYSKLKLHKKYKNRIGICVDTCHIFAGGHDIRTIEQVDEFFNKFDKLIGIDEIKLIHLNDSKKGLGSKKDRHHSLGDGEIGLNGLKYFYQKSLEYHIPVILETPSDSYEKEIKILSNLV